MKKFNVKITGRQSGNSFNIFFRRTGLWDFDGKWECLPGYLFDTGGYFLVKESPYVAEMNDLWLYNRQKTTFESLFEYDSDAGITTFTVLRFFPADVKAGNSGSGLVFQYGATGASLLGNDGYGHVNSEIDWVVL